jgi:hypothetical protein
MTETWEADCSKFVIFVSRFILTTQEVLMQWHIVTDVEAFSQLQVKGNNCKSVFIHCSVDKLYLQVRLTIKCISMGRHTDGYNGLKYLIRL